MFEFRCPPSPIASYINKYGEHPGLPEKGIVQEVQDVYTLKHTATVLVLPTQQDGVSGVTDGLQSCNQDLEHCPQVIYSGTSPPVLHT